MTMSASAIALNRFGLGARLDEPLPADAKRYLLGQFDSFDARPPALASSPSRSAVANSLTEYLEDIRAMGGRRRVRNGNAAVSPMPGGAMMAEPMVAGPGADAQAASRMEARRLTGRADRGYYIAAVGARANAALASPAPFVERLTHFWANHFAVSAEKLGVTGMAGLLEFEAIRPNVLGKFGDMLLAVERHPAMLLYLDQAQSIGPDSIVGTRIAARGVRKAGLNENLAREILELHTLGVGSGYSQADVTEFARAMTGWTVSGITRGPAARIAGNAGAPGDFVFAARLHEPGDRTVIGRSYAQQGEAQARAILADLAVHPATARHIATKLARHFAGDVPPPALVERLSAAFLRSGGDLPVVYRALIDAPEVWSATAFKFKTPWDWSISAMRGLGTREVQGQAVAGLLTQLGQPVWRPGSPAGFDDIAASWAGPDALLRRVEAAERMANRAGGNVDARALAVKLLGGSAGAATEQAIVRAESPGQALSLLLVAPEFLRR